MAGGLAECTPMSMHEKFAEYLARALQYLSEKSLMSLLSAVNFQQPLTDANGGLK
jgi:hypothetical protein